MQEHPVYSGYYVNHLGEVYSLRSGTPRLLKPADNGIGYLRVRCRVNGKRTHKYVHRLIAETLLPNPDGLPEVNHKDHNKQNNTLENLEWVSHWDNMKAYRDHKNLGEKN